MVWSITNFMGHDLAIIVVWNFLFIGLYGLNTNVICLLVLFKQICCMSINVYTWKSCTWLPCLNNAWNSCLEDTNLWSIITPCVERSFYFNYHFPFFVNITKLCCILYSFIIQKWLGFWDLHKWKSLLQFMVFSIGFFSKKKPKNDRHKKNHPVNLDKLFWPCLTWLSSQIEPCHLINNVINKMTDYLTSR